MATPRLTLRPQQMGGAFRAPGWVEAPALVSSSSSCSYLPTGPATPPLLSLGEIGIAESLSPTWGGSSLQWRDRLPSCHRSLKGYWPLPRKWPRPPSSSLGKGVLTSVSVDSALLTLGCSFPCQLRNSIGRGNCYWSRNCSTNPVGHRILQRQAGIVTPEIFPVDSFPSWPLGEEQKEGFHLGIALFPEE